MCESFIWDKRDQLAQMAFLSIVRSINCVRTKSMASKLLLHAFPPILFWGSVWGFLSPYICSRCDMLLVWYKSVSYFGDDTTTLLHVFAKLNQVEEASTALKSKLNLSIKPSSFFLNLAPILCYPAVSNMECIAWCMFAVYSNEFTFTML